MSEIPNVIDLVWRAAASFSGGLCYLVVRRDLPPRKAVGVIVIAATNRDLAAEMRAGGAYAHSALALSAAAEAGQHAH